MESAFRMYANQESPPHPVESFTEFVLHVCAHGGDGHVRPQSELCSWQGQWLPTHIIRWDFVELASALRLDSIPHCAPSEPAPVVWTPEATAAFAETYRADMDLWWGVRR
jgi:hypothetical protein